MLVVLDNCEHLLDAAGRLAEDVSARLPDVRILATSREALAVERRADRPAAFAAGSPTTPARSPQCDERRGAALRRAGAAAPSRTSRSTTANAGAVVEICRRLDGMPLAIELAAARVSSMSPAEIAELLDERFRLLTGGRRTAVERHQTLRATVDWSYSLLDEREPARVRPARRVLGGFDPAAARAVVIGDGVEEWDVLDALDGLVGKSMVGRRRRRGTTRYKMLETMRQYAREQLDQSGDADAVGGAPRRALRAIR